MPVPNPSSDEPARSAHASRDVRKAFRKAFDLLNVEDWERQSEVLTVRLQGKDVPVGTIFRHLWNCTDPMPFELCEELDSFASWAHLVGRVPKGSTYARGARMLKSAVEQKAAALATHSRIGPNV